MQSWEGESSSRWLRPGRIHESEDCGNNVVLGKSCSQVKLTTMHVLPGQKMPLQVLPGQQMPKATFRQPYITIYAYKRD